MNTENHIHMYESEEEPLSADEEPCIYCGWCSAFVESHVEHSLSGYGIGIEKSCKYIDTWYDIAFDDGEISWTPKQIVNTNFAQ